MKKGIHGMFIAVLGATAVLISGCQSDSGNGRHAVAELSPASGSNVRGTVHFYETSKGVRVVAKVNGLTPGPHGFHIHEKGDCSAPDATSAGGHFNPTGAKHGAPHAAERHAGDFGNIVANASGEGRYENLDARITFDGPNSIIGRAVIVHANADDMTTQPTGNAGGRVACGVIQMK